MSGSIKPTPRFKTNNKLCLLKITKAQRKSSGFLLIQIYTDYTLLATDCEEVFTLPYAGHLSWLLHEEINIAANATIAKVMNVFFMK